ncbi:hypothetical protein [Bifidobacterium castoris]|uniref:Uncharacterized protein n=1 Tax=Bifidobacterium castoris TaxID=2306972 RepID=A0A430FAJ5_9BIFI|nr:hypothetical protein [Bifidobacterium castoris]RSX49851.1 hypothetical protein D2E22_0312 [Bifidobacterium castoris]
MEPYWIAHNFIVWDSAAPPAPRPLPAAEFTARVRAVCAAAAMVDGRRGTRWADALRDLLAPDETREPDMEDMLLLGLYESWLTVWERTVPPDPAAAALPDGPRSWWRGADGVWNRAVVDGEGWTDTSAACQAANIPQCRVWLLDPGMLPMRCLLVDACADPAGEAAWMADMIEQADAADDGYGDDALGRLLRDMDARRG